MRTHAMLRGEDLVKFLDGSYPLNPSWSETEQTAWVKLDSFLMSVLLNNMSDEFVTIVGEQTTSAKIWTAIWNQFGISGSMGLVNVFTKLVHTKYKEGDDVVAHLNFFHSLRQEAACIVCPIMNEVFAILLCISIPTSWDHVFSNLPEVVTAIEIKNQINNYANTISTRSAIDSAQLNTSTVTYSDSKNVTNVWHF
jgi:hypothetical protein